MDEGDLYDEFGNYIGPELSDSDSDSLRLPDLPKSTPSQPTPAQHPAADTLAHTSHALVQDAPDEPLASEPSQAIVLAEDKQYYPSAEDVFGPDTEVLVEEEDAQPISEPIIAPIIEPSSGLHETAASVPPPKYSLRYLTSAVLPVPQLIRNVALVGHLHHGKTSFVDMLFDATHYMPWAGLDDRSLPVRYMDTRYDEQELHVSLKTTAATFLLSTEMEKSYAVTVLDTPGHLNFLDEALAGMNLADGAVVFVDVAEGVMMSTEILLRRAAALRIDIVLVISKIDRLCLELRLPPTDAYHKIRHIIDSVNDIIEPFGLPLLSPAVGNVAFSAASERVCFTLPQFAHTYIESNGGADAFPISAAVLAGKFWGDCYYDRESRKFCKTNPTGSAHRTFVDFVLEPFYKLHTAVVSEDVEELSKFLKRNHLLGKNGDTSKGGLGAVDRKRLDVDVKSLLKEVNGSSFRMGRMTGFTDMLVNFVKSPVEAAERRFEVMSKLRNSELDDAEDGLRQWSNALKECEPERSVPMTAYVGKLVPDEQGLKFDCILRVLSGKLQIGDEVRILGDEYDRDANDEDQSISTIQSLYIPCGRFKIEVEAASAGQLLLVRGIDDTIFKSATIVSADHPACGDACILRPLKEHVPSAVVKVAIEPIRPSELPKMVASLRQCVKSFPGLVTKVEESGEHTLIGSGELYMDCVLRDLRKAFGEIEIKVSDPVVPFAETVSETSALQCYADTLNEQNKIVMVAEPLEAEIMNALGDGRLEKSNNSAKLLRDCGWDALAAKSLWTFGPDTSRGPNALLNDVLIQDTRRQVHDVRESIVQGFCWAMREGPLADEPVRGVKLRLLDATIAESVIARSPAQIIPTARRVAYSSMLTANPRLMEPVYKVEITCPPDAVSAAYMLMGRRRGIAISEGPVAGTPLVRVLAHMPVLDSFGFEPDLRSLTHGSAFCVSGFDHWAVMPGDPLDRSVQLRPLEPAGRRELARECMVKTRRRKGMPDEVSLTKYFDDPLLVEIAADNEELRQLL